MAFRNLGTFPFLRSSLQLRQGKETGIECSAVITGTNEPPKLRVMTDLGVDITHLFEYKSEVVQNNDLGG